ncbi:TPA: ATP-binding cassette domain-containing protein, partial [Morganella morganii]
GHWPYYRGNISREQDVMWVPQSLYLPSGTLKSLLAYPHTAAQFTPEAYREVLDATGLAALTPQLDTDADWRQRLSGGEQQRLLIARLLLSQPKLMLLDEITSALDDDNAVRMIRLLRQRLPDSTLLLVSHQRFLQQEADRVIALSAPAATCTSGVRYAL